MGLHHELLSDARRVLDEAGLPHDQIIDVEADCILYVNKMGSARTCWLRRQVGSGTLRTLMEEGFVAEAPEGWGEDEALG